MADYYTKCSVEIPCTKEQFNWLKAELNTWEQLRGFWENEPYDEGDYRAARECLHFSENEGLWVTDNDGWVPGLLYDILQAFVREFKTSPIFIQLAYDCSKPRLDAYGGCAVMITADEIRAKGTDVLIAEWRKEIDP